MRTISLSSRRMAMGAAATLSLAAATLSGIALAPSANALATTMTLNAATGTSAGGNNLTATTAANVFTAGFAIEVQYKSAPTTACTAAYATPVALGLGVGIVDATPASHLVTAKKIAFTVPTGAYLTPVSAPTVPVPYNICVFSSTATTGTTLLASAAYSVAAPPTITATTGISPLTGPSLGGGTLTVTGTNFVAGTTVKIGTVALTGVVVNTAGTSLTAPIPAQAAGAMAVTVTNTRGSANSATLSTPLYYTYSDGIVISPNTTTTATAATDIDVQGVGFSALNFTTTTGLIGTRDDVNSHVYVVDGAYDPTSAKTVGELGECVNVLVIDDGELICTVNTLHAYGASGSAIVNGTYTLTVVSDGKADVQTGGTGYTGGSVVAGADPTYAASIVSSGSTFTVAPY